MRYYFSALMRHVRGCLPVRIAACAAGVLVMVAALASGTAPVMADGALETQKGGLFHRKGWIMPAIYRKASTQPAEGNRSEGGVARGTGAQGGRIGKISVVKRRKTAASGKIPRKIIRRREQSLNKAARLKRKSTRQVKVASLGKALVLPTPVTKKLTGKVTGGSARVNWVANSRCVPSRLKAAINFVAKNFSRVRVNSTCRSRRHNRRVGGASRSWHLKSRAADIRVFGNIRKVARYLRSVVGGYKHYGGGLFHIDTGPRRSW